MFEYAKVPLISYVGTDKPKTPNDVRLEPYNTAIRWVVWQHHGGLRSRHKGPEQARQAAIKLKRWGRSGIHVTTWCYAPSCGWIPLESDFEISLALVRKLPMKERKYL